MLKQLISEKKFFRFTGEMSATNSIQPKSSPQSANFDLLLDFRLFNAYQFDF